MARKRNQREAKKVVYVFWEGESEEAYSKALAKIFNDRIIIKTHREKGIFDTATAYYKGNKDFQKNVAEFDEIWFFFDVETGLDQRWNQRNQFFTTIRKYPSVRLRLLMTKGCIEYWLLLHYVMAAPVICTPTDKDRIMGQLLSHIDSYRKGDSRSTDAIAQRYECAVKNGKWTLQQLKAMRMPECTPNDTEARDAWLLRGEYTFTTVHEALEMIQSLPEFSKRTW